MLKFHHHYITSWFHLSDTPEHSEVEFLLWRRISQLWIDLWAWTGSPPGRNVPENHPEIQLSHFHRLSKHWDIIRKHLCCYIWMCCCSQQDDKVQTHEEFRKDPGLRDASVSQAQRNLPELWKLILLLPPLPARQRVFRTCNRIMLCIIWKPYKIFPRKPPRQLCPSPSLPLQTTPSPASSCRSGHPGPCLLHYLTNCYRFPLCNVSPARVGILSCLSTNLFT